MESWKKIAVTMFVLNFQGHASATSLGAKWLEVRGELNAPAACLPANEGESIELEYADVIEDPGTEGELAPRWVIEKSPGAKPHVLYPGACIVFDRLIEGYRQVGESLPLEEGKTYSFGVRRGDRRDEWVSKLYIGIFCTQRKADGGLAYLPYVRHEDGSVTYPPCGRYIGLPAAPDGIVPLR